MIKIKISSKELYIVLIVCFLVFLVLAIFKLNFKNEKRQNQFELSDCNPAQNANAPIESTRKLNDLNEIHLIHAQKNGLKNIIETNEEFDSKVVDFVDKNTLMKVVDNEYCRLKSLTHSKPYLIPQAVGMINEIGYRFQEELKAKKQRNYAMRVTSLLRTVESQSKLSHRNRNATAHSAHMYGTTIDISYKNFINLENDSVESSYEGVQALTKVITDMREECKLLVVRERKQACFHITVVVCDHQLMLKN